MSLAAEQRAERMARIQENRDRLNACPRHLFDGPMPGLGEGVGAMFGGKMECSKCKGTMDLLGINEYVRGYEAHGGNGNDVLPGWREDQPKGAGNGRRFFKPEAE